jgi:hypothetical protein
MLCAAALVIGVSILMTACDEDEPARLTTNLRIANFQYDPDRAVIPSGDVTLEDGLEMITVRAARMPAMPGPEPGSSGWVYEGWASYPDTGDARFYVSTGRFTLDEGIGSDPNLPTGSITYTYHRDGTFTVLEGGTPLTQGEPLPDTLDFTEDVSYLIGVEPEPDANPGLGPIHPVAAATELPQEAGSVDLIVPVNIGDPEHAGQFDGLTSSSAVLNAATGEYLIEFETMPFIFRDMVPDPGLVYEMWFIDDDTNPPRYFSLGRENPNVIGVLTLSGAIHPGDTDGDGVPEPLDFERVVVSIEPDGSPVQQPVGQGIDTSSDIFSIIPYAEPLPDVRE